MGHSAVETGLLMTPWPLAIAVMAPIAGRLADRYPAGLLGGVGLAIWPPGSRCSRLFPVPAALRPRSSGAWRCAASASGSSSRPTTTRFSRSAPRARSGAAGGMLSTSRLAGQTLGAAGVAILFRAYPAEGSRMALYVAAALALSASLVSLVRLAPLKEDPGS